MFCKYCGAQLPDGSKFCQYCGMQLDAPEAVKPEETVQAVETEAAAAAAAVERAVEPEPVAAEVPVSEPVYQQQTYTQPVQQQYVPPVPPVPPIEPQAQPVQPDQPKKKSKKGLIIGLIAAGVVLIALILLFVLVFLPMILDGKKVEIDFTKYVKTTFDGYDTIGNAEADYDYDALIADYGEQLKYTRKYKSELEKKGTPSEFLVDNIIYYLDYFGYNDLSNGDTVDYVLFVNPGIEDLMNIKIVNAETYSDGELKIPMTVEGLKEAELFDPFENIEITVTGNSPFGIIEYSFENSPEPIRDNEYYVSVDKTYDLANGDVVTFTLDEDYANEYFLSEYGMLPTKTTYEYTVEGLPELLTDASLISAADMDYLKTVTDDIYYNEYISYDDESIKTNSYGMVGTILRVSTSPSEFSWDNNTLYCIYEQNCTVTADGAPSADFTVYAAISFDNVYLDDGVLVFDEDDWTEEYNQYSMDVGNWTISGNYGFPSLDDIRAKFIIPGDTLYTYQDNITK